jgi:hypothetical protein
MKAAAFAVAVSFLLSVACGSDDTAAKSDACHDGCVATVAANCANGPADQAACESDCHTLESSACNEAYKALQTCAEGKDVTCSAQGLPSVTACSSEQAAFVMCLSQ